MTKENTCTKLEQVKGIGPKKRALLERLNIRTLEDALYAYPRDYEDHSHIVPIRQLVADEKCAICATVAEYPVTTTTKKGQPMTRVKIMDLTGTLPIVFFNNLYVSKFLHYQHKYLFYGKVSCFAGVLTMVAPQYWEINEEEPVPASIVPIYPLTAGLKQFDLRKVTEAALAALPPSLPDPLPDTIRAQYHLPDRREAFLSIHKPHELSDAATARRRFAFEELFTLCCGLQQLKERRQNLEGIVFSPSFTDEFFSALSFPLTNAQQRVISEIIADCTSGKPMNRLVQGDVGSGKTIIAAALCAMAAKSGYQAALMAPTEILAQQHMESLSSLFHKLGITTTLLTGSLPTAQKRDVLAAVKSGEAQVVIGTHALIQKGVAFHQLGAIIADEQHRFGVRQRAALTEKGNSAHVLVMSATPIPRTLALIAYGDLNVSILDEMPPGRTLVQTFAVGEKMRERITAFIDKQIAEGGQVYVVCPLIEEGEIACKDVIQQASYLRSALPHRHVAVLHGQLPNEEKDQIMQDFATKKYDILVATTVIEVGVNVPNANLMVVEDAWRFGLSQLHQLRGRVGRGSRQSYCILFGADKPGAMKRLGVMRRTNDGFEIAQADLEQRGAGDFFGERQHGLPALQFTDTFVDVQLMQDARDAAEALLANDPELKQHTELQARVSQMLAESENALN